MSRLEIIRDQSRYIYAALHEINLHLILGSILACLVVLAFMRSWRSTLIAAVAIPASVVATFGMMWALDFTLNSVTMLALVLMVGIVIDDAIVVLENIFRFVEEKKMGPSTRRGKPRPRSVWPSWRRPQPGGDLRPGVLHVQHLGALSLSVRHYGGSGGDGQSAGLLHLTPMMSARLLTSRGCCRVGRAMDGAIAAWLLRLDRSRLQRMLAVGDGAPRRGDADLPRGDAVVGAALYTGSNRNISPATWTKRSLK